MIFFLFKPLDIKEKVFQDVPIFEFQNFTMYELDTQGLKTQMLGSSAAKYSDRYQIQDINYTDYSKKYKANMLAKNGIYKDDIIYLNSHVLYRSLQKNGFVFTTEYAIYNIKTSLLKSDTNYTITFNDGIIKGSFLQFNALENKLLSQKVVAQYTLE